MKDNYFLVFFVVISFLFVMCTTDLLPIEKSYVFASKEKQDREVTSPFLSDNSDSASLTSNLGINMSDANELLNSDVILYDDTGGGDAYDDLLVILGTICLVALVVALALEYETIYY